jgi:hypothetical protein
MLLFTVHQLGDLQGRAVGVYKTFYVDQDPTKADGATPEEKMQACQWGIAYIKTLPGGLTWDGLKSRNAPIEAETLDEVPADTLNYEDFVVSDAWSP